MDVYEEYLYLCRDGVCYRKRNLDECREKARELQTQREVEERTKRIRANPTLYQPFKVVPAHTGGLERVYPQRHGVKDGLRRDP